MSIPRSGGEVSNISPNAFDRHQPRQLQWDPTTTPILGYPLATLIDMDTLRNKIRFAKELMRFKQKPFRHSPLGLKVTSVRLLEVHP